MSKKNYIGLIVLTFLIVVSGVLAYYASTYKGTITTRSKLFAFNVYKIINNNENTFSDIDLYDTAKVHNGVGKVIVPGDYGDFIIKVSSKGSEVKLRYDIILNSTELPSNMKFYLDSDKTDKVEINPLNLNGILDLDEEKEYTIYWEWPYNSGNDNIHDIDYQGKTFTIDVSITGKQTKNTEFAVNYIGFDNSVKYPSIIDKDEELVIDLSEYNYTSLKLKQGNNDLSLDTHYTYNNGILKLFNIIDDVTITNLTSFCNMYNVDNLKDCLIATDYPNFRKEKSLENARNNIESKVADFTKVEPYLTYTENILYNQTTSFNYGDASKKYYYTTTAPTFNKDTGKYTLNTNKLGTIEEIGNANGYTGLSQDVALNYYYTVYKIIDSETTSSNTINITKYDKYSFKLNEDYSSKAGLYSIEDENNTKSYYFRGEVNNNWVSFGGFYWRILRINGDGSIRLIYSGTKENHTGSGTIIGKTQYNTAFGSTYIGYMYNDEDMEIATYPEGNNLILVVYASGIYYFGKEVTCDLTTKKCTMVCSNDNCIQTTLSSIGSNSDNYDSNRNYTGSYKYTCFGSAVVQNDTITCDIISEIAKIPEKNYENTVYVKYYGLFSKSYEDSVKNVKDSNVKIMVDDWYKTNIQDNGLDSYIANSSFCNDRSLRVGDGYTFNRTTRYSINIGKSSPSLICPNGNDRFTLSTGTFGNRKLTYPVGLITIDEIRLAGGMHKVKNNKYYLLSDYSYWTMTPSSFDASYSGNFAYIVSSNGGYDSNGVRLNIGVRPVINLNANVKITSGSGTESDPYVID